MSSPQPVLTGKIPEEGVLSLLRDIEARRTSGVLRVKAPNVVKPYEVLLVAGQLAMEQEGKGDADPVEAVLKLRTGTYELFQRLPELPVSHGDDHARTGSLRVHVPADLMAYCERAGLTGLLVLEREGRRVEAAYDRGELTAIRLDGRDDIPLGEAFAWEDGAFTVEARAEVPVIDEGVPEPEPTSPPTEPPKPARKDDTGVRFLRVLEVALTEIVEEREKRRSPTRTSPPLPPPPEPRPRPTTEPPPPRKSRPDTVKVIYLRAEEAADPGTSSGSRHVRTDVTGETVLPDAKPERKSRTRGNTGSGARPEPVKPTGSTKPDAVPDAPAGIPATEASYVVLLVVLLLAALAAAAALSVQ